MNLTLARKTFGLYGILGELRDESNNLVCYTLEHAYPQNGSFVPKVAIGTYTCVRHPPARLRYETFELQNVPPFENNPVTGILIHILNYNNQSEGCIGVGLELGTGAILHSQDAFNRLMEVQKDVDSFTLVVM